jgi:hypothetical protein
MDISVLILQEITENPRMFVAGATRFDINQGSLGE